MTEGAPRRARGTFVILVVLALLVSLALLAFWGWKVALGYLGGTLVAGGMLGALVLCAQRLVVAPGEEPGRRWPYLLLHVGKFAAVLGLAYVLVSVIGASAVAFAGGYGTVVAGFFIEHGLSQASRPSDTTGREPEK